MLSTRNVNASNGNVSSFQEKRNGNDNVNDNAKYSRSRKVDLVADKLVGEFNNPSGRAFYCKVAWKLSEAVIWSNVERAKAAKRGSPAKLFTYLCKVNGV